MRFQQKGPKCPEAVLASNGTNVRQQFLARNYFLPNCLPLPKHPIVYGVYSLFRLGRAKGETFQGMLVEQRVPLGSRDAGSMIERFL